MQEQEEIRQNLAKPVVLVGMMGSGKSRLGQRLADMLGMAFYDTDRVIEEKAGCTVQEIFANDGEQKFRDVERRTVIGLLEKGPCVIASGGGVVTNPETLAALKAGAVTVWLKADIADLVRRLENAKDRPLLKGHDPETILRELAAHREPLYSQADLTVETSGLGPQDTVELIIKRLSGLLKTNNV